MSKLTNKTLFVSGASRGIGLAIAKRAAQDGANVILAAKTAEPHPKLPGTIYTAAKEIEEAGGKAFPVLCDVRFEDQLEEAVNKGADHFGGIDICVNNASAIQLTNTLQTDMKRYDLMNQINARGTFLTSKKCLPFLLKAENPHILNLSPPLDMNPKWFANSVAYSIAKFGMSLCVLGMAEEFKEQGVAVNALWPRTAIDTAAIRFELGGDSMTKYCRTVEIMGDATHAILTRDAKVCTGNFFIDDEILTEESVTDLSYYSIEPKQPLLLDFYLDGGPNGTLDGYLKMPL